MTLEQQVAEALAQPCEHKGWRPCTACQAKRIAAALKAVSATACVSMCHELAQTLDEDDVQAWVRAEEPFNVAAGVAALRGEADDA